MNRPGFPEDPNICVWLGDDFYFQKKWTKAEKWYKKAISLSDVEYYAWRGLGYALAQRKKFEDSIAALEKAAELNAEDKDILIIIGDLYLTELKDVEKAKAAYEKYVARGGDDPDILDTLDDLPRVRVTLEHTHAVESGALEGLQKLVLAEGA